jgi:hypothetical protein
LVLPHEYQAALRVLRQGRCKPRGKQAMVQLLWAKQTKTANNEFASFYTQSAPRTDTVWLTS